MATLKWVEYNGGALPNNLVAAGHRGSGETLYVARANVGGELTPGKLEGNGKNAYIPYGGKEHSVQSCDLLTCDKPELLLWVGAEHGEVPVGGVQGGYLADQSIPLYIGRAQHGSELIPGKICPEYGKAYVGTGWREHEKTTDYEALVVKYTFPC